MKAITTKEVIDFIPDDAIAIFLSCALYGDHGAELLDKLKNPIIFQ